MEMWSYYTNHKGFVLKFNLDSLPQNFMGPFPVNYSDDFEKLDYSKFKNASLIYQTNVKAKCWEKENEWRFLFYNDDPMKIPSYDSPNSHNRKFYYDPSSISEVILGYRFFDLHEYDFAASTVKEQIVKLKTNVKKKRKFLKFILNQGYKLSMINYKIESSSDIEGKPIKIEKLSTNRYKIIYVG